RTRVWTTRVPAKAATRQWHRLTSAQHEVRRQAGFARLLVFGAHVLAGFGEGFDRRVEVDAVPGRDLVSRDHERDPGFHCTEGAALDAGYLHVAGYRVAGHSEVVFQRRLGRVLDHLGRAFHDLSDERSGHARGDADL